MNLSVNSSGANEWVQLSLFEDVTEEDVEKSMYILKNMKKFANIVRNYESAINQQTSSTSCDSPAKGMHVVIPKNSSQAQYIFFGWITTVITSIIANIADPHEQLIAKLLFVEGKRYSDVRNYMAAGYKSDVFPIQNTAFSEKRRKVVRTISNSLKIIGVLDYVESRDGKMFFNYANQRG